MRRGDKRGRVLFTRRSGLPGSWGPRSLSFALVSWFALATPAVPEERARIACSPRSFDVVPGEPIRLELTIEADSAAPVRLQIPEVPLVKLRAVEKHPVRRTAAGDIVHKRVAVWQALEPGRVKLNGIWVEIRGQKQVFPEITIAVRDPG